MISLKSAQQGAAHMIVVVVAALVVVGGIGTYVATKSVSHASTCAQNTYSVGVNGSSCVKYIQQILNFRLSINHDSPLVVVDGNYGPKTKAAVVTDQFIMGIKQDGVWGHQTWGQECAWYEQQKGNLAQGSYGVGWRYMGGVYAAAGC